MQKHKKHEDCLPQNISATDVVIGETVEKPARLLLDLLLRLIIKKLVCDAAPLRCIQNVPVTVLFHDGCPRLASAPNDAPSQGLRSCVYVCVCVCPCVRIYVCVCMHACINDAYIYMYMYIYIYMYSI